MSFPISVHSWAPPGNSKILFLDASTGEFRIVFKGSRLICILVLQILDVYVVSAGLQEWRQVLCQALACEELSACRKSIRRVLLLVCGGHSAYRDAKATYTLLTAIRVRA